MSDWRELSSGGFAATFSRKGGEELYCPCGRKFTASYVRRCADGTVLSDGVCPSCFAMRDRVTPPMISSDMRERMRRVLPPAVPSSGGFAALPSSGGFAATFSRAAGEGSSASRVSPETRGGAPQGVSSHDSAPASAGAPLEE